MGEKYLHPLLSNTAAKSIVQRELDKLIAEESKKIFGPTDCMESAEDKQEESMDKYTLQEEAYKNGMKAGLELGLSKFWHDAREDAFKPQNGKEYLIKRIQYVNYGTGEFTPRPPETYRLDGQVRIDPGSVMYWAEIPEVNKA